MTTMTLDQVVEATGGHLTGGAAERRATSVETDSRRVTPGALFVALRGGRFNGHDYLREAAAAGSVAAVVDRSEFDAPPPASLPLVRVADTRRALGAIAAAHRRSLDTTKVVAVAGSNGKTGTKRLIDAVLRAGGLSGTASPASFNNDVGVPLTVFAAGPSHDYLVVEIGTNHPGEVGPLSHIAAPDVAVITNCGPEHLAGLRDLDGVRRENARVADGLREGGLMVVNGDDPDLLAAVRRAWAGRVATFGESAGVDVRAVGIEAGADGVVFRVGPGVVASVPLVGRHHAINALAAVAVGREFGLTDEAIVAGLANATGADRRMQVKRAGPVTILDDCYNANPASTAAALDALAALPHEGRKGAVLGDMLELGRRSAEFHAEAGRRAAASGVAWLACVGEFAPVVADAARAAGVDDVRCFASSGDREIAAMVAPGDLVLLKGSRGVRLELVERAIVARFRAS